MSYKHFIDLLFSQTETLISFFWYVENNRKRKERDFNKFPKHKKYIN